MRKRKPLQHRWCLRPHRLWIRKLRLIVGPKNRFNKILTTEDLAAATGSAKHRSAATVYVRVCRAVTDVIVMRTANQAISVKQVYTGRGRMSARLTKKQVIVAKKTMIAAQKTSVGSPPRMKRKIIKQLASRCTLVKLEQCSAGRWKVKVQHMKTIYWTVEAAIQVLPSKSKIIQAQQSA